MAHKYFDPVRDAVEKELAERQKQRQKASVVKTTEHCPVCFTHFVMEEATPPQQPPVPKKEVTKWDKLRSNVLKSIRISYMNWTYLPRSTGEEETWKERLLRYSHFPMATQLFAYFAYRAACQVDCCEFVFL